MPHCLNLNCSLYQIPKSNLNLIRKWCNELRFLSGRIKSHRLWDPQIWRKNIYFLIFCYKQSLFHEIFIAHRWEKRNDLVSSIWYWQENLNDYGIHVILSHIEDNEHLLFVGPSHMPKAYHKSADNRHLTENEIEAEIIIASTHESRWIN